MYYADLIVENLIIDKLKQSIILLKTLKTKF
jgi:hypothetical protein